MGRATTRACRARRSRRCAVASFRVKGVGNNFHLPPWDLTCRPWNRPRNPDLRRRRYAVTSSLRGGPQEHCTRTAAPARNSYHVTIPYRRKCPQSLEVIFAEQAEQVDARVARDLLPSVIVSYWRR